MESHEVGADEKAKEIIRQNKHKFRYIGHTLHKLQKNEAKGKASNCSWCVQHLISEIFPIEIDESNIMLTIIDADSWCPEEYFETIKLMVKNEPDIFHKSIFCPPQIYTRNNL